MKTKKDWEGKKGFEIGTLVSSNDGGVWTDKFCPDIRTLPEEHWEPGYHVFEGFGVIVDKKIQRIYYTTDLVESNGNWIEIKLNKPTWLDMWVYQIATPAGIVGWCSSIRSA